jgi:hypothetical protein
LANPVFPLVEQNFSKIKATDKFCTANRKDTEVIFEINWISSLPSYTGHVLLGNTPANLFNIVYAVDMQEPTEFTVPTRTAAKSRARYRQQFASI